MKTYEERLGRLKQLGQKISTNPHCDPRLLEDLAKIVDQWAKIQKR